MEPSGGERRVGGHFVRGIGLGSASLLGSAIPKLFLPRTFLQAMSPDVPCTHTDTTAACTLPRTCMASRVHASWIGWVAHRRDSKKIQLNPSLGFRSISSTGTVLHNGLHIIAAEVESRYSKHLRPVFGFSLSGSRAPQGCASNKEGQGAACACAWLPFRRTQRFDGGSTKIKVTRMCARR